MIYRPTNIVIGYYDTYVAGVKKRFGYPSCKWLKENKYTEVCRFSNATNGIKPYEQRDAEKQVLKDLGITVGNFTNTLISGFRLISVNPHVVLNDPRGFCITLRSDWLENALFRHHCTISANGTIDGKWTYVWNNKYFNTLIHENDLDQIDIDDEAIDEMNKNIKHFKLKDLEVGAVYEAYEKDDDKTHLSRYVYIGEYDMYSLKTAYNSFSLYYGSIHLYEASEYWKTHDKRWPWNNDTCKHNVNALIKSFKSYPVFIKLVDKIEYKDYCSLTRYCDVLAGENDGEHSIRFAYADSNIVQDKTIIKRIVRKSECQDIRIIADNVAVSRISWRSSSKFYSRPDEYKVLKLDMLINGFKKFLDIMNIEVNRYIRLSPIEKPEDMQSWLNEVEKYRKENNNRFSYNSVFC